ncbi:helix-turn-helix transcriptional regulator [Parvularcula sp. ZS-1/3]|uniref:Helix-turn-helix transcriptional regulator n=1 Tax=Parvularcula mediterranea TaxID=2732508 RepID=A0A7Y3RIN6_9PROT|nr:metalloregulator ArsR/SmtB family transcription factor [Parvularcula mediterranea]NNU14804.1 helix-turn-helix transcriptional regulator [Parvularcula mediterranea]
MNAVLERLPEDFAAKASDAAGLLRTMGNPNRLMILCRLGGGELSVGALGEGFPLSQSALSQHLAVLRAEGLVATRKQGQSVYYRIANPGVVSIIETLASIYCPEMLK